MSEAIQDGTGTGTLAKVNSRNRLLVEARASSDQHISAVEEERAFQVEGTASLASGTVCVLHVKNGDATRNMVITFIRHQLVDASGGTAFPNASNYMRLAFGRTYSSGGSTATVVNTTAGSAVTSSVTAYDSAPTLAGTAVQFDSWYTKAEADMNTWNKAGALIVPPNGTMEISYVGDHSSGIAYARISFYMEDDS